MLSPFERRINVHSISNSHLFYKCTMRFVIISVWSLDEYIHSNVVYGELSVIDEVHVYPKNCWRRSSFLLHDDVDPT
jgi:hypothetical protein